MFHYIHQRGLNKFLFVFLVCFGSSCDSEPERHADAVQRDSIPLEEGQS